MYACIIKSRFRRYFFKIFVKLNKIKYFTSQGRLICRRDISVRFYKWVKMAPKGVVILRQVLPT